MYPPALLPPPEESPAKFWRGISPAIILNQKLMVTIIGYKLSQNAEGKDFVSLKLQGGVEAIQSQQSGRFYLTAKTCYISCTFDEPTSKGLVGTTLNGKVERVPCEPYQYTVKETGEVMTLTHRYEYLPEAAVEATTGQFQKGGIMDLMN
jgi:hypothetical protein